MVDDRIELVAVGSSNSRHADLRRVGGRGARADLRRTSTTSRCTTTTSRRRRPRQPSSRRRPTWTPSSTRWSPPPTTSAPGCGHRKQLSSPSTSGTSGTSRRFPGQRYLDWPSPRADRGRVLRRRRRRRRQLPAHPAAPRRPGRRRLPGAAGQHHRARSAPSPAGPAWRQTIFHPFAPTARLAAARCCGSSRSPSVVTSATARSRRWTPRPRWTRRPAVSLLRGQPGPGRAPAARGRPARLSSASRPLVVTEHHTVGGDDDLHATNTRDAPRPGRRATARPAPRSGRLPAPGPRARVLDRPQPPTHHRNGGQTHDRTDLPHHRRGPRHRRASPPPRWAWSTTLAGRPGCRRRSRPATSPTR